MQKENVRDEKYKAPVLKHLHQQTGLTFTRERKPNRVLFVERANEAPAPILDQGRRMKGFGGMKNGHGSCNFRHSWLFRIPHPAGSGHDEIANLLSTMLCAGESHLRKARLTLALSDSSAIAALDHPNCYRRRLVRQNRFPQRSLRLPFRAAPGHRGPASMTCAVDVKPCAVKWLWTGRVPLGMITMFAGDPKLGKSYVSLAMATALSRGLPLPISNRPDLVGSTILRLKPRRGRHLEAGKIRIEECSGRSPHLP